MAEEQLVKDFLKQAIKLEIELYLGEHPSKGAYRHVLGLLTEIKAELYTNRLAPILKQEQYDAEVGRT